MQICYRFTKYLSQKQVHNCLPILLHNSLALLANYTRSSNCMIYHLDNSLQLNRRVRMAEGKIDQQLAMHNSLTNLFILHKIFTAYVLRITNKCILKNKDIVSSWPKTTFLRLQEYDHGKPIKLTKAAIITVHQVQSLLPPTVGPANREVPESAIAEHPPLQ